MKVLRRATVAIVVLTLFLCSAVSAQGIKQLPANPLVVIRMNNPEGISKKLADWSQKLGLANFDPAFADPLGALKKQLNIKEGLDGKGEVVVGVYESPQTGDEPLIVALLPVSDYKAFLGNLANLKTEGEVSSFTLPDEQEPFYAANWGNFAAITPTKDLLAKKPEGVEVTGAAAKQLDSNDVTVFANMKVISAKALPKFREGRPMVLQGLDNELKRNPQMNQKFVPVIKVVVNQVLNGVEQFLTDSQSATFGINIAPQGITTSLQAEFTADSYCGKTVASIKNSNASLTKGLPARKYFAFGGSVMDPKTTTKIMEDILGPIQKELAALGDDTKGLLTAIDNMKAGMSTVEGFSFGYVQPTAIGQQSIVQAIMVYEGDAKKLAEAERAYMQASADMFKLMPQAPGMSMAMEVKPAAKTVEGVALDQFSVKFNFDANTPEAAQAKQMINMFYGPNGLNGFMGALNDKNYLMVMGGDDELLTTALQSAKKKEDTLSQTDLVKAISAQLPKDRAVVYYVALDNIATTVLDFMGQMGFKIPLKLPEMSPIGISMSTEGAVLRIDTAVSADMIEKMVSAGMQAAMMMQNPAGKRGGL
ncbi:MAG TPA: hypothetical protein VGP99_02235 [Tepidisphaeraceae bacterium]|nr:hypothetical protein [Tepidisphaeraceae bacterium]